MNWRVHRIRANKLNDNKNFTYPFYLRSRLSSCSLLYLWYLTGFSKVTVHSPWQYWSRVLLYLSFIVWGGFLILPGYESGEILHSFWHVINLGFHEAGHYVFQHLGRFMMVMGGTLGQLAAPFLLMLAFIFKNGDYFGASLCLWWLGESFADCAPYINDALAQHMILLGGVTGRDVPGYHDWNYMLNQLSLVEYHHGLATTCFTVGVIIMIAAIIWGGIVLFGQYRTEYLY